MKKYLVICHANIAEFQKLVNDHLAIGWDLQGGIAVTIVNKGSAVYLQAMFRG